MKHKLETHFSQEWEFSIAKARGGCLKKTDGTFAKSKDLHLLPSSLSDLTIDMGPQKALCQTVHKCTKVQ